jgi:hypothetical protein
MRNKEKEMEKLTANLIESHAASFVDVKSKTQADGVTRFAWGFTEMATGCRKNEVGEYKFKTALDAMNFAIGNIKRNHKNLWEIAKTEAIEGIKYRAAKQR